MKSSVRVESTPAANVILENYSYVKVYQLPNRIEATLMRRKPSGGLQNLQRLPENQYVNALTGEVKKYQTDACSLNKWKGKHQNLRRIILKNFTGTPSELFITLTYSACVTDYHKAKQDFKRFWEKFQYHYPDCEYVAVPEPHQSGGWHTHLLVKRNNN